MWFLIVMLWKWFRIVVTMTWEIIQGFFCVKNGSFDRYRRNRLSLLVVLLLFITWRSASEPFRDFLVVLPSLRKKFFDIAIVREQNISVYFWGKWYRLKDGSIKQLSVTRFMNCSVDKLLNFYIDNEYKLRWDKDMLEYKQLEVDQGTEIIRTIRRFGLLRKREYVLASTLWKGIDGSFYGITEECQHPLAPINNRYVRVALFRSGWRIRKVPGTNTCEIRMVHQEDAGLSVDVAKLAFVDWIWDYIQMMQDGLAKYGDGKRQQLTGARLTIQMVPPEFEVTDSVATTVKEENSQVSPGAADGVTRLENEGNSQVSPGVADGVTSTENEVNLKDVEKCFQQCIEFAKGNVEKMNHIKEVGIALKDDLQNWGSTVGTIDKLGPDGGPYNPVGRSRENQFRQRVKGAYRNRGGASGRRVTVAPHGSGGSCGKDVSLKDKGKDKAWKF